MKERPKMIPPEILNKIVNERRRQIGEIAHEATDSIQEEQAKADMIYEGGPLNDNQGEKYE